MIVAHDPGHGRPPAVLGTVRGGIVERDYVLELAQDLAGSPPSIPWVSHVLLRTTNDEAACPTYAQRAQLAIRSRAQLVLCHHVNAIESGEAKGLITFYDPGDDVGREVALAIARAAPARLYRVRSGSFPAVPDDWTKRARWVLEHYRELGLPAVLIEWGFATDDGDASALLSPAVRPSMVACAAVGIARAMEILHPQVRGVAV